MAKIGYRQMPRFNLGMSSRITFVDEADNKITVSFKIVYSVHLLDQRTQLIAPTKC